MPKVKLTVQNITALILKHDSKTIRRPKTCHYRPISNRNNNNVSQLQPENKPLQSNEGEQPTVQG